MLISTHKRKVAYPRKDVFSKDFIAYLDALGIFEQSNLVIHGGKEFLTILGHKNSPICKRGRDLSVLPRSQASQVSVTRSLQL